MKKTTLTIVLLCSLLFPVAAQYADLGTGSLKDKIWWFDWSGFAVTNGASKTFTTTDGLMVTVTFSNVTGYIPLPNVMNTWSGAILHLLYNFSNTAVKPALYSYGQAMNSGFTMSITAARNGVAVPFILVAADAEASVPTETATFQTNGSVWRCVDFYRNSAQNTNPMAGCNTQSILITDTYGQAAQKGQNPVVATESPASGPLIIQTTIDKHNIQGGMAVTYGIFSPVDRGDLPASYGEVQHRLSYNNINSCNYLPPLPALVQNHDLTIGNIAGDADGQQTTNDNVSGVADEEGVAAFPVYDRSGNYMVQVAVHNTTGTDAWLSGWFDVDQDGAFTLNEFVTAKVAPNATSVSLTWSNLPGTLPAGSNFGFRFRLSSDRVAAQNFTGFAPDGEAEDYLVPVQARAFSVDFMKPDTICVNTPLQITNTSIGASTYYWDFFVASIPNSSVAAPPPIIYTAPGTYNIHLTVDNGLPTQASLSKQVVVLPEQTKVPVLDTSTCGDSIVLTSRFENLYNTWKDGSTADTLVVKQSGTYWVNTSRYGCAARDSFICRFDPKPAFTLGNDTVLCSGERLDLNLTMPGATAYQWQDGKTTATYSITNAGKYKLTIQFAAGCANSDSVLVTVQPPATFGLSPLTAAICKGDTVALTASGADTFQWLVAGSPLYNTTAGMQVKPAVTTTYTVALYDRTCNIKDTLSSVITVHAKPALTITKSNDIDCITGETHLTVTGGGQYLWYPEQTLTGAHSYNPIARTDTTTMYYVKATDLNGCVAEDSILVRVIKNVNANSFPVVSAFTPNHDGLNDCFGLKGWGYIKKLEMAVYNRWGQQLFITSRPGDCWDGKFRGVDQPPGTFVYTIKAETLCGTVIRNGTLVLIR